MKQRECWKPPTVSFNMVNEMPGAAAEVETKLWWRLQEGTQKLLFGDEPLIHTSFTQWVSSHLLFASVHITHFLHHYRPSSISLNGPFPLKVTITGQQKSLFYTFSFSFSSLFFTLSFPHNHKANSFLWFPSMLIPPVRFYESFSLFLNFSSFISSTIFPGEASADCVLKMAGKPL